LEETNINSNLIKRPWGSFTTIYKQKNLKIKKIFINPNEKISLQFHKHRSEHWVIIKGLLKITVDNIIKNYNKNETIYIPCFSKHRIENYGIDIAEIIEIQQGKYLEEDDIVRIEDIYGRI